MKRTKGLQRVLALSLACGLILTPAMQSNVYAEDQLPVTRYATPEQALTSFDTDSATTDKTAKESDFSEKTRRELLWSGILPVRTRSEGGLGPGKRRTI